MKRFFDFTLAVVMLIFLSIPLLVIALIVKLTSKGSVFYISDRIGVGSSVFKMYKFRTMEVDTPQVATHLLSDADRFLTPIGGFLRKMSLDELPQLLNVLKGEMTFVGPRPALFNQHDLIGIRAQKGIDRLIPGITGWAQINGRDELPIPLKAELDEYYLKRRSFVLDMAIIWKTFFKVLKREGVQH